MAAKDKEIKTNAMRILDKNKVSYKTNFYECDEFIDAMKIADMLNQPYDRTFKTLVTEGKSKNHYVFVIPIDMELDLKKAAKSVGEKSIEMIHVKDIKDLTGYIRGGCTPVGMKKLFKTIIHTTAMEYDEIIISGGCIGAQIFIEPNALAKVVRAEFAEVVVE
ncbi:MAG: Cys-tRNA(Pro) deacylase [Lachnospiraceae bacterium]|nr:Cys-tRNA(Pro) deacylase [Lachnospiraceae bacterium]